MQSELHFHGINCTLGSHPLLSYQPQLNKKAFTADQLLHRYHHQLESARPSLAVRCYNIIA